MTKTILLTGLAILATILVSSVSFADAAQVDYFLKLPGVDGESTRAGHVNEIEVVSWSWGRNK